MSRVKGQGVNLDTAVKMWIYRTVAETSEVPDSERVPRALSITGDKAEAAFGRLSEKRLLVLEPGSSSRLRVAPPFSAVETPFRVEVQGRSYYANCVWDALGIPAALHQDGDVEASDGFTGEPISLSVRDGQPVPRESVIHFAVPAARWWDDIIYT